MSEKQRRAWKRNLTNALRVLAMGAIFIQMLENPAETARRIRTYVEEARKLAEKDG